MKKLTVLVAITLVAAACSSATDDASTTSSPTTTSASDSAGGAAATTTTSSDATTTSQPATSTSAAAAGLDSCVVGDWELNSQKFFDDLFASMPANELPGEFTHADGAYVLLIGADGTFTSERQEWTFEVTSDFGDLVMTVSSSQSGTYTLEGDSLITSLEQGEPVEVSMVVDGVPFQFPEGLAPVSPPSADFEGALVTCDGDVLTATFEGFQSMWQRVG